jgi:hypothetical protein
MRHGPWQNICRALAVLQGFEEPYGPQAAIQIALGALRAPLDCWNTLGGGRESVKVWQASGCAEHFVATESRPESLFLMWAVSRL